MSALHKEEGAMFQRELEKVLDFDPLAHAEVITGKHYSDSATGLLGLTMHMSHSAAKEVALRANDDTYWAQPLADWMRVVEDLGFRLILCDDVPGAQDKYRIWWHSDGLLLKSDSYGGDKTVNGAEVVFNYRGPRHAMHSCSSGFACELQEGYDYKAITSARIARLPAEVQEAINWRPA